MSPYALSELVIGSHISELNEVAVVEAKLVFSRTEENEVLTEGVVHTLFKKLMASFGTDGPLSARVISGACSCSMRRTCFEGEGGDSVKERFLVILPGTQRITKHTSFRDIGTKSFSDTV